MESAATDQAMRQMMEASHKQIEELREEISNLKRFVFFLFLFF